MLKETDITIRPAKISDSKAISVILRESGCLPPLEDQFLASAEARTANYLGLRSGDESHTVLVAEDQDGEVAGYIAVHWLQYLMAPDTRGYVSELFVRQSARGRGIGRRLLEVVKEQAIKRGCSRLMVVNVRNRITYPRRFFLKLGWKERPEVTNFILPIGDSG